MDRAPENGNEKPVVATGLGRIVLSADRENDDGFDVTPWLKSPKTRKFMGKQDQLAVIAAGRALRGAGVDEASLPHRAGIYLCVGYIPFERQDLEPMVRDSTVSGRFCMERFSTEGVEQVNPLLTFRCLPNMPIFHVSMNFGIQGSYFITYPGVGQFYLALERAVSELRRGAVDLALVGAVADQDNFLVRHHVRRLSSSRENTETAPPDVSDSAGCLCLELESSARKRGAAPRLEFLSSVIEYEAPDLLEGAASYTERLTTSQPCELPGEGRYRGPTSLPVSLSRLSEAGVSEEITHKVTTRDGFTAASRWRSHE